MSVLNFKKVYSKIPVQVLIKTYISLIFLSFVPTFHNNIYFLSHFIFLPNHVILLPNKKPGDLLNHPVFLMLNSIFIQLIFSSSTLLQHISQSCSAHSSLTLYSPIPLSSPLLLFPKANHSSISLKDTLQ